MEEHLKDLLGRYREQFGSGPGLGPGSGTCLMKIDGVGVPFIKSLYRAAASLYRSDPWRRLRPGHLLGVRVGKDREWYGRKQPFPCVQLIGGDGGDLAIHMFRSAEDARKTTGARETLRVGNVELMRVTYEVESLMLLSNKRMIKCLGVEKSGEERFPVFDVVRCRSSGELEFRNPTFEELRFAYAVVMAVGLVHPLLREGEDANANANHSRIRMPPPSSPSFQPFIETVDVQWPAEMNGDLVAVTVSHPPNQGYQEEIHF
ncbi:zinc finger MYND domain protein [Perilla frutescens var. hirtella]|nr:zinc finger MYND domain protein [Perilla frutescens var. frutescens]KAH6792799.1 zinc finger MYND domain protein [Perilla frutescens var. hirtella]